MYERFTDRARKVMTLANKAAHEFNHEYIGVEHMLIGLTSEGRGVAAFALKNLGLDDDRAKREAWKFVKPGPMPGNFEATSGAGSLSRLPLTPRVRRVVERAAVEADDLQCTYIGTEHLLLALLHEPSGAAFGVLMNAGIKVDDVRACVADMLGVTSQPLATAKPDRSVLGFLTTLLAVRAEAAGITRSIADQFAEFLYTADPKYRAMLDSVVSHTIENAKAKLDPDAYERQRQKQQTTQAEFWRQMMSEMRTLPAKPSDPDEPQPIVVTDEKGASDDCHTIG